MTIEIHPIGVIKTPYKEKFGIPRQPGLVKSAQGCIELATDYTDANYVKGLEQFSHLWLLFQFHQNADKPKKPLVRPPRLGGNEKIGVFATRSTFRPNNIGMSLVKLESIQFDDEKSTIRSINVSGVDLLDGTPILDIKPYLPYADIELEASAGFAQDKPNAQLTVIFSEVARQHLKAIHIEEPHFQRFIMEVLAQDPRPAYISETESERIYGIRLSSYNVRWQVQHEVCVVLSIENV